MSPVWLMSLVLASHIWLLDGAAIRRLDIALGIRTVDSSASQSRRLHLDKRAARRQYRLRLDAIGDKTEPDATDDLISQLVREGRVSTEDANADTLDMPLMEGGITRCLHQSWKSRSLPAHFKHWQQSWKQNHPGWEYRLWTDADNRELVAR